MNRNVILILPIILFINGCASTSKQCLNAAGKSLVQNGFKTEISEEKIETLDTKVFYEDTPLKEISGISNGKLVNNIIKFLVINQAKYEEYSAPIINKEIKTKYSVPSKNIALTTIFSPIILPLAATNEGTRNAAFGCTEQQVVSETDLSKKVKTGKIVWKDVVKTHKFLVSGFNKDYIFDRITNSLTEEIELNLTEAILNSDISKNTILKITCLDCELSDQEDQGFFKDLKKSIELSADFRDIKVSLVSKQKQDKLEQAQREKDTEIKRLNQEKMDKIEHYKREKEEEIQRINKEKEELMLRKETLGVPLEGFKEQCKQLGFQEKSIDFGNCVLQLNNSK